MQINYISPVTFGYSKRSQKYLEDNIGKIEDPALQSAVLDYSKTCNQMEDTVKINEKKKGAKYNNSDYVGLFLSMKDTLLSNVVMLLDGADEYLESEYDYYSSSLKRCKNKDKNWRQNILDQIRFWNSDIGKTDEEIKNELEEARKYKAIGQMQIADVLKTYGAHKERNEDKVSSTDEEPVVEKLARTEFSPKGMDDVMGMEKLKSELTEDVIEPVNNPEQAKLDLIEYGKRLPSGILLYGPPGCGKTYIIEALSAEIGGDVYVMNNANTGSKFVNQTSNNIRQSFEYIYKKGDESEKPVILFMDELDAMTSDRDNFQSNEDIKATAALLKYIEGAKAHNVIIIGATNKYDMIDPAIRRRFDTKRYVGLPDKKQRMSLLANNLSKKSKGQKLLEDKEALEVLAGLSDGYSCHSINIIADDASMLALKRGRADISLEDFDNAISETDEEKIDEALYKPKSNKKTIGFAPSAAMVLKPRTDRLALDPKKE